MMQLRVTAALIASLAAGASAIGRVLLDERAFARSEKGKEPLPKPRKYEEYIKESEEGLSMALGPRWSKEKLDQDADQKTAALLHSISGSKTVKKMKHMMKAMMDIR